MNISYCTKKQGEVAPVYTAAIQSSYDDTRWSAIISADSLEQLANLVTSLSALNLLQVTRRLGEALGENQCEKDGENDDDL